MFFQDVRYAVRTFTRMPGFTIMALLTLALGIGANTAMFSVVRAVLLKPLPYREPGALIAVWDKYPPFFPKLGLSPLELEALERESELFAETAWYRYVPRDFNMSRAGEAPFEVHATFASEGLFSLLGVAPASGLVLSDRIWRQRFGGDPAVVGHSIRLGDETYTVTGVMPAAFDFPAGTDVWLPPGPLLGDERTNPLRHALGFVARLRPGITVGAATSRVEAIFRRLTADHPKTSKAFEVQVRGLQEDLTALRRPPLLLLWTAVGFVLLIACGNVANLLLSRASSRRKEFAIRTALGAPTGRIVQQLLTESLVLSLAGGVLGLFLALWGVAAFSPVAAPVDLSVLAFLLGIALVAGIFFGLAPLLELRKITLKPRSGGTTRNVVVVLEFAMALVVVAGAGILAKSFLRLMQVDPGFEPNGLLTLRIAAADSGKPALDRIEETLKQLPGVKSVAVANTLPLIANRSAASRFTVPGHPLINPDALPVGQVRSVSPAYFGVLQIPLRSGRPFVRQDLNQPVVIVNESLALRFWPGQDAVGRKFVVGPWGPNPNWATIIGVVGDVKQFGLDSDPTMDLYFPGTDPVYVIVRGAADAVSVQRAVQALGPGLAIADVRTMREIVAESAAARRWTLTLLSAFAGLALILALIGIYGVTSWAVAQRTREIGIRIALGAGRGQVIRAVIGRGLVLSGAGLMLGLAGAFALRQYMASMTFGVSSSDPQVLAGAVLLMLLAAMAACCCPALRASRVDPLNALRSE